MVTTNMTHNVGGIQYYENTINIMEGAVFCEDTLLSLPNALRFYSYLEVS